MKILRIIKPTINRHNALVFDKYLNKLFINTQILLNNYKKHILKLKKELIKN